MYLIFDTETTGLPKKWSSPLTDFDNWPRAIQVAWQVHDLSGNCLLYTSDAADDTPCVDLGGRRII